MQGWRFIAGVVLVGLGAGAGYLTAQDRRGAGPLACRSMAGEGQSSGARESMRMSTRRPRRGGGSRAAH